MTTLVSSSHWRELSHIIVTHGGLDHESANGASLSLQFRGILYQKNANLPMIGISGMK
jgi:hypothetical protein